MTVPRWDPDSAEDVDLEEHARHLVELRRPLNSSAPRLGFSDRQSASHSAGGRACPLRHACKIFNDVRGPLSLGPSL
jgi:hypothetical protein